MTWEVGSWIFDEPSLPSRHNASFTVMDLAAMSPANEFDRRLRSLIDEIHSALTAEGLADCFCLAKENGAITVVRWWKESNCQAMSSSHCVGRRK